MYKNDYPLLGILGGLGPYAGLDFFKKVMANTKASGDQEHLPTLVASVPHVLANRTEYLLQSKGENPGENMANIALWLENAGATHIAVPCNTAHSARIWDYMLEKMAKANSKVQFIHIIDEAKKEVALQVKKLGITRKPRVGLLATNGTIQTGLYPSFFSEDEFELVYPSEKGQEKVMDAIFNTSYGLKAFSENVKQEALDQLFGAIEDIKSQDIDLFILGCTELPFALTEKEYMGLACIDPVVIQARALIRATYPDKLLEI